MRLRPLPLLLAPFGLLILFALLGGCANPPNVNAPGGGFATAAVSTAVLSGTSVPGVIPNASVVPFPTQPPPTPVPTLPSAGLSVVELKYRLLDRYPDFFFCDPDFYPVARADETALALQRFAEVQADAQEFPAILAHNGLAGQTSFTDEQKVLIYQQYKKLAALHFNVAGDRYQFQFLTSGQGKQGTSIQGTIDGAGQITITQQSPAFATCPICLAAHTRISTPRGAMFVEDLRPGDLVWTVDRLGKRITAAVLKVARVPVSAGHLLLHVKLDDGRELWASPPHPTADGRTLAQLQPGDTLDGGRIVLIEPFSYSGGATYDLLPDGGTGDYWADGILIGSTLH